MNVLSRYAFISNFNAEKITRQEAASNGVGNVNFAACDTNGDNELSIDEILANKEACDSIIQAIQAKIDKITAEENIIKSEAASASNKEPEKFSMAA